MPGACSHDARSIVRADAMTRNRVEQCVGSMDTIMDTIDYMYQFDSYCTNYPWSIDGVSMGYSTSNQIHMAALVALYIIMYAKSFESSSIDLLR